MMDEEYTDEMDYDEDETVLVDRVPRKPPRDLTVEEEIIHKARSNFDQLPMLEVVFDRFALSLGAALKSYTSTGTDVAIASIDYMSCGDALDSLPSPGFLVMTNARPWDGRLLLALNTDLLFSTLELMLGGRSIRPRPQTPRFFTMIEKRVGARVAEIILAEMAEAFATLADVQFVIEELENNPRSTILAPPASPCVKITLDVMLDDRGGQISVLIPHATLEPVRGLLSQVFLGGQLGGDQNWRNSLKHLLSDTPVSLEAILTEVNLPMTDVLRWAPGQTIDLGINVDHMPRVTCSGHEMFRGAMGRCRNGSVALRIVTETDPDPEETPADDGAPT